MRKHRHLRRSAIRFSLVLLGLASIAALSAFDTRRAIRGTVYNLNHQPVSGAAVQLEDEQTLAIISRITDGDGVYSFYGLNGDHDYSVTATKNGTWSDKKHSSRFDSERQRIINLQLDAPGRSRREEPGQLKRRPK